MTVIRGWESENYVARLRVRYRRRHGRPRGHARHLQIRDLGVMAKRTGKREVTPIKLRTFWE